MWRYMKVQLHVPVHVEVDEDAYFEIRKRKSPTEQRKAVKQHPSPAPPHQELDRS